jgi:hypothetical protein
MSVGPVQDTSFYQMIHEIAGVAGTSEAERRGKLRLSFPTTQAIAPYVDGSLPLKSMFRPVQCQDLSTTGLAFYLPEPPKTDRIVVELSTNASVIYLTAAIAHCRPASDDPQKPLYLIGCRFIGRVIL